MGGIATPLGALTRAPLDLSDEQKAGLLAAQFVIMAAGMAGFARFTQTVFRPHATWAKGLSVLLPLGMLAADVSVAVFEGGFLQIIDGYLARDWEVVVDDDAEAAVRQLLPPGTIDERTVPPVRLHMLLAELDFCGILKIEAAQGEGDPAERVVWTRIDALPIDR